MWTVHASYGSEVTWPIERLWISEPEKRDEVIAAIRRGDLCVDASYVNLNTSICSDEELFHVFKFSRELQRLSGVPADVFQQFDIPGISWGLVPVMAQEASSTSSRGRTADRAATHTPGI